MTKKMITYKLYKVIKGAMGCVTEYLGLHNTKEEVLNFVTKCNIDCYVIEKIIKDEFGNEKETFLL